MNNELPLICWVNCPNGLNHAIDEGFDLCPSCAEKEAAKCREKYPDFAEVIFVRGGHDYRDTDELAACCECHCELGCSSIALDGRVIETSEQWEAARAELDGE